MFLWAGPDAFTADEAFIPPAGEILENVRPDHPRLLIGPDAWESVRERVETQAWAKEMYNTLLARGEEFLDVPPPVYNPEGRTLLTAVARPLMHRVYTLALLANVERDPRFAERAWEEMKAVAEFPDWNHRRHFLDTAELVHGFAIGYDWLYHYWDEDRRATLRDAIVRHGLRPGLCAFGLEENCRVDRRWVPSQFNWNLVCNGGLAIGALAIADREPEVAGKILERTLQSAQSGMRSFAPDGGWAEGPGYWRYAAAYNQVFLAALQTALGGDFGLSKMEGVSRTGYFGLYMIGPFGATFNFGDRDAQLRSAPFMRWMASRYDEPVFAHYQEQFFSPAFAAMRSPHEVWPHALDLLWAGPSRSPNEADLPLHAYFQDVEVALFRSAWDDPNALFAGFKAGRNDVGHPLLDIGSFVLDASGHRWALHLGGEAYSRPGYWDRGPEGRRWHYYRTRAEGHNTLVVAPGSPPDQDPAGETRIVRFESSADRAFAIADLTHAYRRTAEHVSRGVAMIAREKVLIQDEIQTGEQADIWWFMHTRAAIEIASDGRSATLVQEDATLRAYLLSPPSASLTEMEARALPYSPQPAAQNPNRSIRKLAIKLSEATDARISLLLVPGTEEVNFPKVVPLRQW